MSFLEEKFVNCVRRPIAASHVDRTLGQDRGFTLIELMIAIVVVAILATIAYPSYAQFVQRARITDAMSQLNDFRTRMEQAFQDHRRYDRDGECAIQSQMPVFDATRHNFEFTCGFIPGRLGGYRLLAQGNDGIGLAHFAYELVVDPATGALTRTTVKVPARWMPLPSPNTCWQVRNAGKCS